MKRIIGILLILLTFSSVYVSATPYQSYTYNAYDEAIYSPDVYVPKNVFNGNDFGIENFKEPSDIFVDSENNIYITDTNNNRIIELSEDFKLKKIHNEFNSNEQKITLSAPKSLFVDQSGKLFISDTGNKRIIVADKNDEIIQIIDKPTSKLFPSDKEFLPMDLVVTDSGTMYVLSDGIYQGMVCFDNNYKFSGFYGSANVEISFKVVMDSFWKKFSTKEQKSKMKRYVPVQYSSLAIDNEGFIYASISSTTDPSQKIKKLNPLGENILTGSDGKELKFGDHKPYIFEGNEVSSIFNGICVSNSNCFASIDTKGSKIFVYSEDGELISAFGGKGSQKGTFVNPTDISFLDQNILVLDSKQGTITLFEITEYGKALLKAHSVYMDGQYEKSLPLWEDVLKYSNSSYLANLGYGKALYQIGEFDKAMKYFETCNDKNKYSDAYKEIRDENIRKNFILYISIFLGLLILVIVLIKLKVFKKIHFKKNKKGE